MIAMDAAIDLPLDVAPTAGAATDLIDLLPGSPFRPLDWRWERAGLLLGRRDRRRRRDDGRVLAARRFRSALARAWGDVNHPGLTRDHPEILGAYLIHLGDPSRRWEV